MKTKEKINTSSVVKRNNDLPYSKMDDEVVMLSIQNSEYYGMNSIGSRIWEIIEQPKKVSQLVEVLVEEYDVEEKECENDVLLYLDELLKKSVILLADSE